MTNIRWGIIGTGSIATAFAHSIKYSDNSSLVAVHGRNEKKLGDFCKKCNRKKIAHFLSGYAVLATWFSCERKNLEKYLFNR